MWTFGGRRTTAASSDNTSPDSTTVLRLDLRPDWGQRLVAIGTAATVAVAVAALLYANQSSREQQRLNEQGQITDRFSKAVDQLGSDKVDVRLGGIYALERIMRDSSADAEAIVNIMCAFVSEHFSKESGVTADVDAAQAVLARAGGGRGPDVCGSRGGLLVVDLSTFSTLQSWTVDLTASGKIDWIKWGYLDSDASDPNEFAGGWVRDVCRYNAHCVNRKSGANKISDFTPIGDAQPYRLHYAKDPFHYSWSDGSPLVAASGVQSQVYMGLEGNGFEISVPADSIGREFTLYVGAHQAKIRFDAALSDHSAVAVSDDLLDTISDPSTSRYGAYTVRYHAASPFQTLTVRVTVLKDYGGANISIFGAILR